MSQLILDPSDQTTVGPWQAPPRIPPNVRAFGRFPDVDAWEPGDVILVSALKPQMLSRRIIRAQEQLGFAAEHARWHHAAIYAGNANICEAVVLRGVRQTPLYDYIGTHRLRIRRAAALPLKARTDILINAMGHIGEGYSLPAALMLGWRAMQPWSQLSFAEKLYLHNGMICSQLFANAYTYTTLLVLDPEAVTPATLSHTTALVDVPTAWRAVT